MSNDLRGLGEEISASRETVKALYDAGQRAHLAHARARLRLRPGRSSAPTRSARRRWRSPASSPACSRPPSRRPCAAPPTISPEASSRRSPTAAAKIFARGRRRWSAASPRRSPRSRRQLAAAADQILAREPARAERFVPLSRPDAVLRYAGDFLPSWAGAISIDLLPAVLVLILMAVHAAIRREEDPADRRERHDRQRHDAGDAALRPHAARGCFRARRGGGAGRAARECRRRRFPRRRPFRRSRRSSRPSGARPQNVTPLASQRGRGEAG